MIASIAEALGLNRKRHQAQPKVKPASAPPTAAAPKALTAWEADKAAQLTASRKADAATMVPDIDNSGDDDAELLSDGPLASARGRERTRIQAIVQSQAALSNPELAISLAVHTDLTRREAIAFLDRRAGAKT